MLPIVDTARRIYRNAIENPEANEQFLQQMFDHALTSGGMTLKQFHDRVIEQIG